MSPLVGAAASQDTEAFLLTVLVQLSVIIAAARVGAWLFSYMGQPQVVGETAAGLLLGPSFLGRISPQISAALFPDIGRSPKVLSELGLVFLMFLIGLEFEFGHIRKLGRTAAAVSIAGIILPFALGLALGAVMYPHVAEGFSRTGFVLFMAVCMSITAMPVLGRILMELNLTRTRLGALTITSAAVDDAVGWTLLATISAIVAGEFEPFAAARMLAWIAAFTLAIFLVARPLLIRWIRVALVGESRDLSVGSLAILLVIILLAAMATNLIGIFSVFGPFVLGAALWDQHEFREAVTRRLRDFVTAFFLPIFFTYTGLRTNIALLDTPELWLYCGLVLAAAIAGKTIGCGLAARFSGLSWRESGCVATLMNTRGLMELIAVNIGRELGVIPDSVFCMLVIMAVVTTLMTTPIVRRLLVGLRLDAAP